VSDPVIGIQDQAVDMANYVGLARAVVADQAAQRLARIPGRDHPAHSCYLANDELRNRLLRRFLLGETVAAGPPGGMPGGRGGPGHRRAGEVPDESGHSR
jgi:hypothetical protein